MATAFIELERRRADRQGVELESEMRRFGLPSRAVRLLDISVSGCSFSPAAFVQPGQSIFVRLPGLRSCSAVIAWVDGGRAACKFDEPINAAVIARVIEDSKTAADPRSAIVRLRAAARK